MYQQPRKAQLEPTKAQICALAALAGVLLAIILAVSVPALRPGDWQDLVGSSFLTAAVVIGGAVYFTPSIVAGRRNHPSTEAIFALNLFLGWSLLVGSAPWCGRSRLNQSTS